MSSSDNDYLGREAFSHLLTRPSGACWWCEERPATTGEHKFKRTDLARLMRPGETLLHGSDEMASVREIKGRSGISRDRYGVIKFPKSMCGPCNNSRSQPFDKAYEEFSEHVASTRLRILPGVSLAGIFGDKWEEDSLNLARYYAKHFGCRMVRAGLPVPQSLRDFLNGDTDMPDSHMGLITTDSVYKRYGNGLSISPDYVTTDRQMTRFISYTLAVYVGAIGVRYLWLSEGIPGEDRSQFFHFPHPVLNYFANEVDVVENRPRRPGWFARLSQWLNRPTSEQRETDQR